MSFVYGCNGNDIEWDLVGAGECITCYEEQERLISENPGHPEECEEEDCELCEWENGEFFCEGHTWRYEGDNYILYHDTNGNFVRVSHKGGTPDFSIFTPEYLMDWFNSLDEDSSFIEPLIQILAEKTQRRDSFSEPIFLVRLSEFDRKGYLIQTDHEQNALDLAIDFHEKEGNEGFFLDDADIGGLLEDGFLGDHVCGGNHGRYLSSMNWSIQKL